MYHISNGVDALQRIILRFCNLDLAGRCVANSFDGLEIRPRENSEIATFTRVHTISDRNYLCTNVVVGSQLTYRFRSGFVMDFPNGESLIGIFSYRGT